MLIDKVLFRDGNVTEIITLESIEHHRDYLLLKEHLYCATPNCSCKMNYIREGKRIAHFKKWIGRQHSKQCPYYKEPDLEGRPKRVTGTRVILNAQHISGVLKNIRNRFWEEDEQRQLRLAKGRARARSRNININKNEELFPESTFINKPTTSNVGKQLAEGDKAPSVRTRLIEEFRTTDLGETQATAGYFKEIVYEEATIMITMMDKQKLQDFTLYLEEVFFANSIEGTRRMLGLLQEVIETLEHDVDIACVGEIIEKDGQFGMRVMRDKNLRFDGYEIPRFINKMDSLFNYVN